MPVTSRAQLVHLMYVLDELRTFGRNRIFDAGDQKVLREYLEAVGEWDSIQSKETDGRRL